MEAPYHLVMQLVRMLSMLLSNESMMGVRALALLSLRIKKVQTLMGFFAQGCGVMTSGQVLTDVHAQELFE